MQFSPCNHTFAICCYQESPFLEECIQSVREQDMLGKIIMTTGTPNSYIASVAKKHQIPLYINPNGGEISKDWNFAIEKAETELVTLAHQDDIYEKNFLKKVLFNCNKVQKPLIVFTDYGELRENVVVTENKLLKMKRVMLTPLRIPVLWNSRFIRRRILAFGSAICCPSVTYIKPNLPEKLFESGYRSDLDWQTWEKISKIKGAFIYCNNTLMYHRIHKNSATTAIIIENDRTKEDLEMFCKFWPVWVAKIIEKFYGNAEKSNEL